MPLSPKAIFRFGKRSKTARPISAVRMLASVIWNRQRPLNISARWVRPVYFSRRAGDTEGNVWKCSGPDLVDGRPQWLPLRMPHRLHLPRARQLEALEAELGRPVDLGDGGLDVPVRQV